MTFLLRRAPVQDREQRLAALLAAARSTPFYCARLASEQRLDEECLAKLPTLSAEEVYRNWNRFRNPSAPLPQLEFRYPIQPSPEVTILVAGFRPSKRVRVLTHWDDHQLLQSLEGGALAAPVHVLRALAADGRRLDYPLVAFTGPAHGLLTDADRDRFWRCFQVPVFEQWLGLRNEVLAEECESHDSLHIQPNDAIFESVHGELLATSLVNLDLPALRLETGLAGDVVDGGCRCGKPGSRLTNLAPVSAAVG
jgi:hypothetical protein